MVDTLGTIKSGTGLGSGLDIESIVSQLVEVEGAPKSNQLDSEEAVTLAKISAFGNLKGALSTFRDSLNTLKEPKNFQVRTASINNDPSSNPDITFFTATANSGAIPGSYTLEVEQLAQAHKLGSAIYNTESTVIGTGTLNITVGFGQPNSQVYSIAIGSGDQTLEGIRSAINARSSSTGVSATIITSDAGAQLVLSSNNPGVKNTIDIAVTNDGDGNDTDNAGLSQLATANMTVVAAPLDGQVRIDGQLVTVSSNTLTDVIEGVTIDILKAEDSKVHTLNIKTDRQAAKDSVESFKNAYNDLMDITNELTKFVSAKDRSQNGDLIGDPTLRNISNQLRNALVKIVNDPTGFSSLASIGITTDKFDTASGKLSLDSTKLDRALSTNFDAVGKLFGAKLLDDGVDGIGTTLFDIVNRNIQDGGILDFTTDKLNQDLDTIADERTELQRKLKIRETDLTLQFSALDALLGQLNQVSSQLAGQLSNFVDPLSFKK